MDTQILYEKYKNRPASRLIKLKNTLIKQAQENNWEIPVTVEVINEILKSKT